MGFFFFFFQFPLDSADHLTIRRNPQFSCVGFKTVKRQLWASLLSTMSWFYILGWFPSVVAVFGNALVVFLIASRPRSITGLSRPWLWLTLPVGFIYFPTNFLCGERSLYKNEIAQDIAVLAIYSSITNLCAMETDRYIAIMEPLRYVAWMTSRRATIIIALAWLIPLILDYIPALCTRLGKCSYRLRWLCLRFFPVCFCL